MMLSSIFYIAAIASRAIAAPAPFYARALEQVNSFERDLDVYPRESWVTVLERDVVDGEPVDDLFTRFIPYPPDYQAEHAATAQILESSRHLCEQATDVAARLDDWGSESHRTHLADKITLGGLRDKHRDAINLPFNHELYNARHEHEGYAAFASDAARNTIQRGRAVGIHPELRH